MSFPAADAESVSGDEAAAALRELLDAKAGAGAYVATMAYLAPDSAVDAALTELRSRSARARTRRRRSATARASCTRPGSCTRAARRPACSCSWSTEAATASRSPASQYDFAALVRAQAIGDGQALRSHELPFLRVELDGANPDAIAALAAALA